MVLFANKHAKYEARRRGSEELTERKRASRRAHHARNRDRLNAARGERARANPEPRRAAYRRHVDANPEHVRALKAEGQRRRRAVLRGVACIEHVDALVVLEAHDGVCGICGRDVDPLDFEVDHVVPLARGGEHSYANTQPAHPVCNRRKGARSIKELSNIG